MAGFNKRPKNRGAVAPSSAAASPSPAKGGKAGSAGVSAERSKQLYSTSQLSEIAWGDKGKATEKRDTSRADEQARKAQERRRAEDNKRAEELRMAEEARRAALDAKKSAAEAARADELRKVKNVQRNPIENTAPIKRTTSANTLTSELFLNTPPVKHETQQLSATNSLYLSGTRPLDNADEEPAARPHMSSGRSSASRPEVRQSSEGKNGKQKKKKPNIFVRIFRAIFPCKGDGVAESVRKIIFDVAVVAFVITGGSVLLDVFDEFKNSHFNDKAIIDSYRDDLGDIGDNATVEEIVGSLNLTEDEITAIKNKKPGINVSFMELYNKNPDIVGWIRVGSKDNAIIDYPVVQAEDNDYYLTHNFDKETSKRGAIYADYRNSFEDGKLSGNTILYGHNMWNGDTMFAKLSRYYDARINGDSNDRLSFYKEHPTITFNTLYENSEWKVFACGLFNTQEELGEVYQYNNIINFDNKSAFNSVIRELMDRSVIWTDVDLTYGDEILTLSTCYYPFGKEVADTRVAVFARKVREGESAEVDVSKAVTNNNPLKFAKQYAIEGGSWTGSTWDTSKLLSFED